jgi:uncharacterized RDD family membrane protein YckC
LVVIDGERFGDGDVGFAEIHPADILALSQILQQGERNKMAESHMPNPYAAPEGVLDDVEPDVEPPSGPELASRWSRLLATVVDHVAVTGMLLFAYWYGYYDTGRTVAMLDGSGASLGLFMAFMFGLIMLLFNLSLLRLNGQTLGKKLMHIKIVRSDGHSYVSLWRIIGLRFLPILLAVRYVPVIGQFVWGVEALTIFGPERKCLHDYLADTIVIVDRAPAPKSVSE